MVQLSYYDFVETICNSYKISQDQDVFLDLPCEAAKIKNFTRGKAKYIKIIKDGIEYPFLIKENKMFVQNPILENAGKLKFTRTKGIETIEKELNIKISSCNVKICDGNGWYSMGKRYSFGRIFCEV
jgi:hypothetical protein